MTDTVFKQFQSIAVITRSEVSDAVQAIEPTTHLKKKALQ